MGECQSNLSPFGSLSLMDRKTDRLYYDPSTSIDWTTDRIWHNSLTFAINLEQPFGLFDTKVTIDWPLARPDQLDSSRAEMTIDDKQ